ncbi:hypothetical protein M0R04_11500 [Candidatus Dojkabacteria bacterium]|jgi:hypothetical protein|nr:hypothetical protein [Candidatus Dojkabacteria bacterium]
MALQKAVTTESGIQCSEAYININNLHYLKNGRTHVTINAFYNKDAKDSNCAILSSNNYVFSYDYTSNLSIIVQAYTFLKTLPEFSGAIDV